MNFPAFFSHFRCFPDNEICVALPNILLRNDGWDRLQRIKVANRFIEFPDCLKNMGSDSKQIWRSVNLFIKRLN